MAVKKAKQTKGKKAVYSNEARAETKRVVDLLVDFRIENGVTDFNGNKDFYFKIKEEKNKDRLAWLENQRVANFRTKKEIPIIPTVEERMEKLDTTDLSVEEMMLAKQDLRNERIQELNKIIY